WKKGEKTSTNPVALIFAWTGALSKRAEIDNLPELKDFANRLESATLKTIGNGEMTGDLAKLAVPAPSKSMNSWEFIDAIASRMF
ncbi:MAG: NADP-dependent isocitrate dehydrogenase, partial [Treponema sp.]|nr:NADP-dependent isocitrate dehydrogenase [Treponema sp.]